jgi:epoxyqueuosine reductase
MENVIERLYARLEQRGARGKVVSIRRVQELRREIEDREALGLFDQSFQQERLRFYEFSPPGDFVTAQSVIVAAVPRPQTKVNFTWNGRTVSLILPPTYVDDTNTSARVGNLLTDFLGPEGYRLAPAKLPAKCLAVRSGLGDYGRNNICYVSGMGSLLQLAAFYSDLPCEEDSWREPSMMDKCRNCTACLRMCPTGAIPSDRFLLHAERCIVFHNERSAEHPFPAGLDLSSHDCVVGCMYCQRFCPEDKPFLDWFEGNEEFSDEETSLLLEGASPDRLPAATIEKLKRLDLLDYLYALPRNLGAIFKSGEQSRRRSRSR